MRNRNKIREAVALQIRLGLSHDPIGGDGYEALITRDGIVVGRAYIGSIEEVESEEP